MINSPELPRSIALVVAGGAAAGAPSGNLTIQEIIAQIATWIFPQVLPPLNVVAILLGGMGIYTTRFRLSGPDGEEIATANGPDVPFTTQIKRSNLIFPLTSITADPVVKSAGLYRIDLLVRDITIASTPLDIIALAAPPPGINFSSNPTPPSGGR